MEKNQRIYKKHMKNQIKQVNKQEKFYIKDSNHNKKKEKKNNNKIKVMINDRYDSLNIFTYLFLNLNY